MAQQTINIGTSANDGTGDPLRTAFDKINDNFNELYTDDAGDVNSVTGSGGLEVDQTTGAVTVSISDSGVTTAKINADAVDGTKIADDSIDSEHIADGSIDEPHLNATNAPTDGYVLTYDSATTGFTWEEKFDGDITGIVAGNGLTGDATSGDASLAVGAGTGITVNANDVQISDGGVGSTQLASSAVTNAKINNGAVNIDKLSATLLVTEAEGISSNDNDTTLPTSAAVKDYVDTEVGAITDNDTLGALTATDGGFVVGNGSAFVVETGSTARDSVGLGTSNHAQFHCLGIGEAASTVSGQIDATTVYADTFGKDSGDYINWTTDTQMDFYVNGSNEMRLEADGDLHVDGDVIAASTTVSSDEKLKENIKPIFAPLETLNQIKGVDFNFIKGGKKSSGVIAQDIQKVMPHLVKEVKSLDSDDSHLTVDYNGLIGLLIESVKTLSEKVEKLENR